MEKKDDNLIINPNDINKQPVRRKVIKENTEENIQGEKIRAEEIKGTLKINYTTNGRFTIPSILHWDDFTVEDVNNIALSDQEDLLNNVISILNKVKTEENYKVEDMSMEEFLETLIAIKLKFNTSLHNHTWICDCQNGIPESDRQFSNTEIDLKKLNFKKIEEADEDLKKLYKKEFKDMSDEDFREYLRERYSEKIKQEKIKIDINTWTKEEELKTIVVNEPNGIIIDGHQYLFNFSRVGDLLEGQRRANKKFAGQIKRVQSEKIENMKLIDIKTYKEEKINKIKRDTAKYALLVARAISMVEKDGKQLNIDERIEEWKNFSRQGMLSLNEFFDSINFGLYTEMDLQCNICGGTFGRSLQQEFNFLELLPLSTTTGKSDKHRRFKIFTRF